MVTKQIKNEGSSFEAPFFIAVVAANDPYNRVVPEHAMKLPEV